jgi:carbon-monoxide dehydrogenase large subunit
MGAVVMDAACKQIVEKGKQAASEKLEASAADIEFSRGRFTVKGTDRRVGLFELARAKPFEGDALFADKIESYPTGVMVCEVEIDPETGNVRIDRFTSAVDAGVVVNPRLLEGQMQGGIVHGLGNALMEQAVYDEQGQLLTGTLMDYALPRADDVPGVAVTTIATPSPNNILGFKGVGELPTNGAPAALGNAVMDALRPFGVRHIDMPITAAKVWQALHKP